MHRALFIREILFHICSALDRDCKADLAALARTCQTFKEPALDVLWEHLSGLSPLARCLPEVCKFNRVCASFHCSVDIKIFSSAVLHVQQTAE